MNGRLNNKIFQRKGRQSLDWLNSFSKCESLIESGDEIEKLAIIYGAHHLDVIWCGALSIKQFGVMDKLRVVSDRISLYIVWKWAGRLNRVLCASPANSIVENYFHYSGVKS